MQFKKLIDDITFDLQYFGKFASIEYIRKKYNLMANLKKITSNKKILSEVVVLSYNQVCNETLSLIKGGIAKQWEDQ